jgi:Fe-S-cluster containining protein
MTECNCCGSCCSPVVLPFAKFEASRAKNLDPVTRRWILEDLTPMGPKEAKARGEGWIFDQRKRVGSLTHTGETILFLYSCRHFDEETRLCTNHDNRPPGCRGYPWKHGVPDPTAALPPTCSYNADVDREVAPVRFIRKPDGKVQWPS